MPCSSQFAGEPTRMGQDEVILEYPSRAFECGEVHEKRFNASEQIAAG
jgi:hypothetical protein